MLLMPGVEALFFLFLIFVSSIPAIAVFLWFSIARYPFSLLRFSFSLLAGATSFFPALFLQNIFPAGSDFFYAMGKWRRVAEIFVHIAFTEELSRLIMLIILFFGIHQLNAMRQKGQSLAGQSDTSLTPAVSDNTMAGASGLIAGLGFAILESAVYGASNPVTPLLRIFTAAPLHGACGFRVGSAAMMFKDNPIKALSRFLFAVLIHGLYDLMLLIPGTISSIVAVLIALATLASSVVIIRNGMKDDTPDMA
jgi:RsiW-degrading membrane proteinase PrsW (M82 family)